MRLIDADIAAAFTEKSLLCKAKGRGLVAKII